MERVVLDSIENIKNDKATLQKMIFLINALEDGWSVKKDKESYVFTKRLLFKYY